MKINSLLQEGITASSSPENMTNSAPKFGRSEKFLEDNKEEQVEECTTSGSVASVASPVGGMQRRAKGSMLQGIKTSEKFPNSKAVKEDITDEGFFGFGEPKQQKPKQKIDYDAVRRMSQQSGKVAKQYHPDEYVKRYGAFAEEDEMDEGEEFSTFAALNDWTEWNVMIFNNFYRGKYADYGPRLYSVVASSPEEARQVVLANPDYVLKDLLSRKLQNGKKVLPRGSALPIEDKRVGGVDKIKPGSLTTMGFKEMLTPKGPMKLKFSTGKIVASEDEQKVVQGTDLKTTGKADLGDNSMNLPSGYGDVVQPQGMKEAKKSANTKTFRAGLSKRPRKEPSEAEKAKKQSDSDAAWERLMAYAEAEKNKEVKESDYEAGTKGFRVTWLEAGQKCTTGLLLKPGALEIAKKLQKKPGASNIKVIPYNSVNEMDGDGSGRDGSNRKRIGSYGNRDRDMPAGPDIHLGPEHAMKKKDILKRSEEELNKAFNDKELEEGVWGDTAKLVGIPAVAGALAVGANHLDQQQPHVDIGGQSAKIVSYGPSQIPDYAMTLQGKDGKTYRVWTTRGAGGGHATLAVPTKEVKEGMDDAVNYTLDYPVDKEYVYQIVSDGKDRGIYNSLEQAKHIVKNMKKTGFRSSFKIVRKPRSKMAGPQGVLPEQGVAEGHAEEQYRKFGEFNEGDIQRWAKQSPENKKLYDAYVQVTQLAKKAWDENDGSLYTGLKVRRGQIRKLIGEKMFGKPGMPQAGEDFGKTDLPPSHPQSAENVWRREQGLGEAGTHRADGTSGERSSEFKYPGYKRDMSDRELAKLLDKGAEKRRQAEKEKQQGVAEGTNVDSQIKRIKDRILQLKDWNTAGTHDKKIKELQARLKELQSQKQGVAEAFIAPALSAANANAEFERKKTFGTKGGGYKGRVKLDVEGKDDYINVKNALTQAAKKIGHHVECGLSGNQMSVFSDSMNSNELDNFIDNILPQMMEESSESDRIQALYDKLERMEERLGYDDPRVQAIRAQIRGLKDEYHVVGQNTSNSLSGMNENSMADFFAKAAQEKFPHATIRKNGQTIQEPPKREVPPQPKQAPIDVESLKQQLVDLEKRYEQLGGDSWQYADRMMDRDREAQQVGRQINYIKSQIAKAGEQLDEKSKSQAQFRTMAAVAHNPKFAKKVGISQKVGKEFHKADKGANYKSLPKKVDEAEVSEDKLASDLYQDLQIFKKGADKDIGTKAKDKEIGNKPKDKDIVAKEDCWDGYKQIGMKKKNGKTVPNCVPKK